MLVALLSAACAISYTPRKDLAAREKTIGYYTTYNVRRLKLKRHEGCIIYIMEPDSVIALTTHTGYYAHVGIIEGDEVSPSAWYRYDPCDPGFIRIPEKRAHIEISATEDTMISLTLSFLGRYVYGRLQYQVVRAGSNVTWVTHGFDKNTSYLDLATDQGVALEYQAVSDSASLVMSAIRDDN